MDKSLKKPMILTILLIVVLVVILVILGSGSTQDNPTTLNIFSLIIILALLALVWFKYFQQRNVSIDEPVLPIIKITEPPLPADDSISTKTGAQCEKAGTYICKEHNERTVEMQEGKRFPPCRGDGTGHSAVWIHKD
ncbi:MAG: hypothetical protein VB025_07915 [Sphaerochaeta sp.]|nr:hypothetical protein [Sphaerochaeta sp.]PKL25704.1 MAG: hypothetical protein CVV46_15835 [Spirochaetae bacterium HGW-Spirochaetae-2]